MSALKDFDLNSQSVIVEEADPLNSNCSGYLSGKSSETDQNTIYEIFENCTLFINLQACKKYPNNNLFGYRKKIEGTDKLAQCYTWNTFTEVYKQVEAFSNGLFQLCINELKLEKTKLKEKSFLPIGIYSVNRKEWCVTDFSTSRLKFVSVALFDTFGPETLEFVINHAELQVVVASKDKIKNLLSIRDKLPKLKAVISMDVISPNETNTTEKELNEVLSSWAKNSNVVLLDMEQVSNKGKNIKLDIEFPKYDDLYTICYTSGTTGNPKGAMLNHISFSCGSRGIDAIYKETGLGSHISYLPLAHCFERLVQLTWIRRGNSIGFYSGNILNLMDDIKILKPVSFISVPRLLNRVYDGIKSKTLNLSGLKGMLARYAVQKKLHSLKQRKGVESLVFDKILFNKIKEALGGNVKAIVTGSAPLSDDILNFLKVAFACDVSQGYGLTETSAALSVTLPGEHRPGHCGPPLPCCEIKLLDVPEMNYRSSDKPLPRGEILVRGLNLFSGYYKDEEKTKEVIDDDGWFHTGDIGTITEYGEYIAPEKIEGIYQQSKYVMQAFVYGDPFKSYLIGIIVPDETEFAEFGRKILNNQDIKYDDLFSNKEIKTKFLAEINSFGKRSNLNGFELMKKVHLQKDPFTIQNGMITPTFKLKRQVIAEKNNHLIEEMYASDRD